MFNGNASTYIKSPSEIIFRVNNSNTDEFKMQTNGNFHADGNIVAYSTSTSDVRLKHDIVKLENCLDKVMQLSGYEFTYNKDGKRSIGVLAQEVEQVAPTAVIEQEALATRGDDTLYKTVEQYQLLALLIESIKELKHEIEELKDGNH